MDKKIINEIIENLNNDIKEKGEFAQFKDSSCKPVRLSKNNFHHILDKTQNNKIVFIDAGNAEILKAPNFSLQLIRVYYSIWQNNKKKDSKREHFYTLTTAKEENSSIIYNTKFFGVKSAELNFDSFDETIRQGSHRISISSIANVIRRFIELNTASKITDLLSQKDIILLDGDLKATITNEINYLNKLYKKAEQKNIIVCALSKTSELFTEKGNALIPVLEELAPKEEWFYYPLVEIEDNSHKAQLHITKLHKNSKHAFKLEIFNKVNYDRSNTFSLLRENSTDPVFLGYPYGLIDADKGARITNNEKEHLKTIFLTKLGKDEKFSSYLNTLNAHNILDSISFLP
jgi:hypothetical protein